MERFKVTCPNDPRHGWFFVREDSGQTWLADEHGKSVELIGGDAPIPGFEDFWLCRVCGVEAKFVAVLAGGG